MYVQYVDFLMTVTRGDFGTLIRDKRPAMCMVLEHFWPAIVELAVAAIVLSTVLAIPLGVVSATHKNTLLDHLSRVSALLLQSMPSFWLGLVLILIFAVWLQGLLPSYGSGSQRHLILPAVTLAAGPLAQNVRLIRAGMLEVLSQEYIRTARAKGLAERLVIEAHNHPSSPSFIPLDHKSEIIALMAPTKIATEPNSRQ
jgi:peptide/nickel transport system permease protein